MSAVPPSEADLQAKAAAMKKAETKVAEGKVDPAVIAAYKKVYADNGGDKAKCCAAFELDAKKWDDSVKDADSFCIKFLGAK